MSKISDYKEKLRQKAADDDRQTVGEYAAELKKDADFLLLILKEAGIPKASADDNLTSKDKHTLLKYLKNSHGTKTRRKKKAIHFESEKNKLIKRVAKQENGAELEALREFASMVIFGENIDPEIQKLANLIVAKAVFIGALPMEKLGRPKLEKLDSIGLNAAERYWELIDSGVGYQEAVESVSNEFHKSERHIMRLISKHKKDVGETPEERSKKRKLDESMSNLWFDPSHTSNLYKAFLEPKVPFPELELDDLLEHLEELTNVLAASTKPLTIMI